MRISDWSSDVCSSDLIVEAVMAAAEGLAQDAPLTDAPFTDPGAGAAVGARLVKTDGPAKVTGRELYGADKAPAGALWLRVIRAPHARARFTLGDLAAVVAKTPGLARLQIGRASCRDRVCQYG